MPQYRDWEEVRVEHGGKWPLDTSATDLDRALDHLHRNVTVLGITERYGESRQMLAYQLGWSFEGAKEEKRWRVSTPKGAYEELNPALIAEIESLNTHDMTLYAHAVALFEQRLELCAALVRAFP